MPDRIRGFQTMIHVSLGFGAVASLLQMSRMDGNADAGFVIAVQVASMAALAFFCHLITHHGGNWVRWACAIVWCVGLPFLMMAVMLAYRGDVLVGGLLAAQTLIQGAAVAMLFTEDAGNWFEA